MNQRGVSYGLGWLCVGVALVIAGVAAVLAGNEAGGAVIGAGLPVAGAGAGWAAARATTRPTGTDPRLPAAVLCRCEHDIAFHASDGCNESGCRCMADREDVQARWDTQDVLFDRLMGGDA